MKENKFRKNKLKALQLTLTNLTIKPTERNAGDEMGDKAIEEVENDFFRFIRYRFSFRCRWYPRGRIIEIYDQNLLVKTFTMPLQKLKKAGGIAKLY
jgi:hypothetical protein